MLTVTEVNNQINILLTAPIVATDPEKKRKELNNRRKDLKFLKSVKHYLSNDSGPSKEFVQKMITRCEKELKRIDDLFDAEIASVRVYEQKEKTAYRNRNGWNKITKQIKFLNYILKR